MMSLTTFLSTVQTDITNSDIADLANDKIARWAADSVLDELDQLDPRVDQVPSIEKIATRILRRTNEWLAEQALAMPGTRRPRPVTGLEAAQIGQVLIRRCNAVRITAGYGDPLVGIYCDSGPHEGLYVTDEDLLSDWVYQLNETATSKQVDEVITYVRRRAPKRERTTDPDLVPVSNGVFNYKTKELMPFSPDYVFLSKSTVDFDPEAENPVIHNDADGTDWDVETWVAELTDDPELTQVLWEIAGACIRPHVRWNRMAWFYSEKGNNGKGTFCEMLRGLVGERSCESLPLKEFSDRFALEPLQHASAIINDENAVGAYLEQLDKIKAVVTNDVIRVDRKFKTSISFRFWGFMVQCINDLPQVRDKSESFYRRQLFVPFTKCFTGAERRYIKDDYLRRPEVLRYVLKKVLVDMPDYYEFTEAQASKELLEDYKFENDPVRDFWNEMRMRFTLDVLPNEFLYDVFKAWYSQNYPSGKPISANRFWPNLRTVLEGDEEWDGEYTHRNKRHWVPKSAMDIAEPLIIELNLTKYMTRGYTGTNLRAICDLDRFGGAPQRCVLRRVPHHTATDDDTATKTQSTWDTPEGIRCQG